MLAAPPVASRRVTLQRYGVAEVLQAEDGEAAAPREGDMRIHQRAIGVNSFDVCLRRA